MKQIDESKIDYEGFVNTIKQNYPKNTNKTKPKRSQKSNQNKEDLFNYTMYLFMDHYLSQNEVNAVKSSLKSPKIETQSTASPENQSTTPQEIDDLALISEKFTEIFSQYLNMLKNDKN